jgi:hypothetical protein
LPAWWFGDPPRKLVTRYMRWFVAPRAPVEYLALYDLHRDPGRRQQAFIARVTAALNRFG